MTIHALCGALLRRFPIEAGVAPHFETIDERTARELLIEARAAGAARRPGRTSTPLGRGARHSRRDHGGRAPRGGAGRGRAQRVRLLAARAATGAWRLIEAIHAALGAEPGRSPASSTAAPAPTASSTRAGLLAAANAPRRRSRQRRRARPNRSRTGSISHAGDRLDLFQDYRQCFLTKEGPGRKCSRPGRSLSQPGAARR